MVKDRALLKSIASGGKDWYDAAVGGVWGEKGLNPSCCPAKQFMRNVV